MEQKLNNLRNHSAGFYRVALIVATVIWGGNFVVMKGTVDELSGAWVTGLRFSIAAVVMGLVFLPHIRRHLTRDTLKAGLVIAVFSFLGYWAQVVGLSGTTPAKNAFLSACYCVTTPFIWWLVVRKPPTKKNIAAALICVIGMAFVTLKGDFELAWGDAVSILAAVLYGAQIVVIALFIKTHDLICISFIQMAVSGILGCAVGCLTNGLPDAGILLSQDFIVRMAYVAILSSFFATTIQNLAQTHVPPNEAGILFALEGVFGTIFSVIFYHETLTATILIGFVLILAAILITQHTPEQEDDSCVLRTPRRGSMPENGYRSN